jgi:hypothetical protein
LPDSLKQCVWAAAQHWNQKLGYDVFEINTTPVSYLSHATECIVKAETVSTVTTGTVVMDTSPKNSTNGNSLYVGNTGFDIRVNPDLINNARFQSDIPILSPNGYVYTRGLSILNRVSFYATVLHELGHGLGLNHDIDENHNGSNPVLDGEIMYCAAQSASQSGGTTIPLAPSSRVSLTTGNAHSLSGAIRIYNDSRNTTWTDPSFGTFGSPIDSANVRLTLVPTGTKTTICGINNAAVVKYALTRNNITLPDGSFSWKYRDATGVLSAAIPASNLNFTGQQTSSLGIKYKSNFNPNNYKVQCTASYNSCPIPPSAETLIKAYNLESVTLSPFKAKCKSTSPVDIALPDATPAGGTYAVYDITTGLINT